MAKLKLYYYLKRFELRILKNIENSANIELEEYKVLVQPNIIKIDYINIYFKGYYYKY